MQITSMDGYLFLEAKKTSLTYPKARNEILFWQLEGS